MTEFDIMFAMFGLLVGLAIAEVLGGFARVLRMRRRARIGWLTPLLGLVVLFDLNAFWITAWTLREVVTINSGTQTLVLLLVGGYYLVATLIFPDDPDEWPDFDAWYDRHNRIVLGGMISINLALLAISVAIAMDPALSAKVMGAGSATRGPVGTLQALANAMGSLILPGLIAVWLLKNRKLNGVLLAVIALTTLVQALASF